MSYTLAKFFIWALGFALLGGVVGWMLRNVRCQRDHTTAIANEAEGMVLAGRLREMTEERDELLGRVAALETVQAQRSAPASRAQVAGFAGLASVVGPDLTGAAAAFGKRIEQDDLTVVEGIGPALARVLHAAGITSWASLGASPAESLAEILTRADSRNRMHDTSSWPRQARLAAIGEWDALKQLQVRLTAGRSA